MPSRSVYVGPGLNRHQLSVGKCEPRPSLIYVQNYDNTSIYSLWLLIVINGHFSLNRTSLPDNLFKQFGLRTDPIQNNRCLFFFNFGKVYVFDYLKHLPTTKHAYA